MNRKNALVTSVVVLLLALLAYLQFRTWRRFSWDTFFATLQHLRPSYIVAATLVIYATYVLRAARWSLFLRESKHVPFTRLISPMMIGFTAVAILGRPGDFVRPYLISRRENVSFTGQVAALIVERLFDMAAFALLLSAMLLLAPSLRSVNHYKEFQLAGAAMAAIVVCIILGMVLVWRFTAAVAAVVRRLIAPLSAKAAHSTAQWIDQFGAGLHTLRTPASFASAFLLSIVIWLFIAASYVLIMHAYIHPTLESMDTPRVLLVMAASVLGSLLQIPMVGGGSQLATIGVLRKVFDVPQELAASCGLMLWLITFFTVVPLGLVLARREHVSLTKVSEESHSTTV